MGPLFGQGCAWTDGWAEPLFSVVMEHITNNNTVTILVFMDYAVIFIEFLEAVVLTFKALHEEAKLLDLKVFFIK